MEPVHGREAAGTLGSRVGLGLRPESGSGRTRSRACELALQAMETHVQPFPVGIAADLSLTIGVIQRGWPKVGLYKHLCWNEATSVWRFLEALLILVFDTVTQV
jgi:hypothetical protein